LRLRLDLVPFAGADGVRLQILDALVGILAHINPLNLCRLERTGRFAVWPSVERRIAQPPRFKKDRSGQQPLNSGQKRRIENLDNLAWRMSGERQPGRT
jgi:hypothetical protein